MNIPQTDKFGPLLTVGETVSNYFTFKFIRKGALICLYANFLAYGRRPTKYYHLITHKVKLKLNHKSYRLSADVIIDSRNTLRFWSLKHAPLTANANTTSKSLISYTGLRLVLTRGNVFWVMLQTVLTSLYYWYQICKRKKVFRPYLEHKTRTR